MEYDKNIIIEKATDCSNIHQLAKKLGVRPNTTNYNRIRNELQKLNIKLEGPRASRVYQEKISKEELLIVNKECNSKQIRKYIERNKILNYACAICNCPPIHNNKKLVLQLDHINGIYYDNRIENLRWLCPNCHSQTDTFAGRNLKKSTKTKI